MNEEKEDKKQNLKSINENLRDVNEELENKVRNLEEINEYLQNLMEAIEISIIVVGREDLTIKRYNKSAEDLFQISEGQSVIEVLPAFMYNNLADDIDRIFIDENSEKKILQTADGGWYTLSIELYKTKSGSVEGAVLTFVDVTGFKIELESKIEERNRLQQEILKIEKKERWRIGQYLHDETAQKLVGVKMLMDSIAPELNNIDDVSREDFEKSRKLIRESLENIRELSHFILPLEVGKGGVLSSFQQLTEQTEDLYGIECTFESGEKLNELDYLSSASYLYYIAQEAIRNSIHHGEALNISVSLYADEQCLFLEIKDDGRGFEKGDQNMGMGINIMRYRAELLGGTLEIKPVSGGKGSLLICCIPLDKISKEL